MSQINTVLTLFYIAIHPHLYYPHIALIQICIYLNNSFLLQRNAIIQYIYCTHLKV